jgi:hypothetical protein
MHHRDQSFQERVWSLMSRAPMRLFTRLDVMIPIAETAVGAPGPHVIRSVAISGGTAPGTTGGPERVRSREARCEADSSSNELS